MNFFKKKTEKNVESLIDKLEKHPLLIEINQKEAEQIKQKRIAAGESLSKLELEKSELAANIGRAIEKKLIECKKQEERLKEIQSEYNKMRSDYSYRLSAIESKANEHRAFLIETADEAIDEAVSWFTEKHEWLRSPLRFDHNHVNTTLNMGNMTKINTVESNSTALKEALKFCMEQIRHLGEWKFIPVLNIDDLENLKKSVPDINQFHEATGIKSIGGLTPIAF